MVKDEIVFYKTHAATHLADVIACRVHFQHDQDIRIEEMDGLELVLGLFVGEELREVFAVSDELQKDLWFHALNDL